MGRSIIKLSKPLTEKWGVSFWGVKIRKAGCGYSLEYGNCAKGLSL
jgi:hypothetical protein